MPQKLAVKRLTASDLTFFEWHHANQNAGNQKAINLNADVFVNRLYPGITELSIVIGERLPLDLYIYGPGLEGELNLQRKIVKGPTYKNWRLNGEFVHNPPDNLTRFNSLAPDDFVVMRFLGEIYPNAASMFFVAASEPEDTRLHQLFSIIIGPGKRSMVGISKTELSTLVHRAGLSESHPLHNILIDDALEDAAQNGIEGIRELRRRASNRQVSMEALRQARENAGRIGRRGEEFVNVYFTLQKLQGKIQDFGWTSSENAIAPYDFEISIGLGRVYVDVKSTEGEFESTIHISFNELLQMRDSEMYDLYRVYQIEEKSAKLRIAQNLKEFARATLTVLETLPSGVRTDSISVVPEILGFGESILLEVTEGEDGILHGEVE